MSLIITVPAAVPSVFHSSRPKIGSQAEKRAIDPSGYAVKGAELWVAGNVSLVNLTGAADDILLTSVDSTTRPTTLGQMANGHDFRSMVPPPDDCWIASGYHRGGPPRTPC